MDRVFKGSFVDICSYIKKTLIQPQHQKMKIILMYCVVLCMDRTMAVEVNLSQEVRTLPQREATQRLTLQQQEIFDNT